MIQTPNPTALWISNRPALLLLTPAAIVVCARVCAVIVGDATCVLGVFGRGVGVLAQGGVRGWRGYRRERARARAAVAAAAGVEESKASSVSVASAGIAALPKAVSDSGKTPHPKPWS